MGLSSSQCLCCRGRRSASCVQVLLRCPAVETEAAHEGAAHTVTGLPHRRVVVKMTQGAQEGLDMTK